MTEFNAERSRTKRPLPLWVDAFQRDTQTLGPDEIGVYFLLLMAMWSRESCDLEDDEDRLARVARVSPTVWKRRYSALMRTFFTAENGKFFSKRLKKEAEFVAHTSEVQSGRKKGKSEDKSLKNNDTMKPGEYPWQDHGKYAVGPGTNLPTTYNLLRKEEDAQARDLQFAKMEESPSSTPPMADPVPAGLVDDLIQSLGVDPVNRPVFWREPAASAHIAAWLTKLDLTPDQILAAARDSRTKNPEAPDGPKALDRWMAQVATGLRNAAGVKGRASGRAEARPPPSPEERMDTYAKAIKDGTALGRPQFVSVQMAQALLNSGRVTIEDLRMRGIAA